MSHNYNFTFDCFSTIFLLCLTVTISEDDHSKIYSFIEYQVIEEQPAEHFVGNLVVDFGLDFKYPPSLLPHLRFHSLTKNRNSNSTSMESAPSLFHVHRERGILTTNAIIDREVLCPKSPPRCYVRLDIAVQPASFFQILKVQIEVTDVNDNIPVFPCTTFFHQISEASDEGSSFLLPTATDEDSGRFTVQNYDIVPSHGVPFELKRRQSWSDAGVDEVRVIVREKLDREKQDSYEFVVVATDGGNPCLSGVLNVKVVVLDVNDNKPQFDKNNYELWMKENTPLGTILLELHAEDRDEGANGHVNYNLSFNSNQEFGSFIGIGKESGQLYLKEEIDFEKGYSTISLSVVAQDKGNDPLQTFASVLVHVQDVNDNQPIVTVTTLTPSGYAEVSEDVEVGTFVAHVSVVDHDIGSCGHVSCEAMNEYFEVVRLYKSEFKLVTTKELMDMPQESSSVSVSCSDCGMPRLTTMVNINILLKRKDDETIGVRNYEVSLEENFLSVDPLLILQSPVRHPVSYELIDRESCEKYLELNKSTGEVRQLMMFDYEEERSLTCMVSVRSGSGEPCAITIRIIVVDRNDERPRFDKDMFVFCAPVNKSSGQVVGRLRAQDKDSTPFNSFYFSFIDANGFDRYIYVEKWTGILRTATVLIEPRFLKAKFGVYEVNSSESTSTAEVIVHVLRPNDNTLFYIYRSVPIYRLLPDRASIQIGDNWSPKAVLARVGTYDGNSTSNRTYLIASGNEESHFTLDDGVLRLAKKIESCQNFVLNLTVFNGGDSAWLLFNVSTNSKRCRSDKFVSNYDSIPLFDLSSAFHEHGSYIHPLASGQLSVVLSGVLIVIIIFVILGLFFLFESNKQKRTSSV